MTTMDYTSVKELIASGVDNSFSLIKKFTDYWNTLVDVYTEYEDHKLADEVLRKIFPVYRRFYLKKYCHYGEKRLLRVFKDESPDCKETMQLSDKIAEMLGEFRDGILQLHGGPKTEPVEPTQLTWSKKTENFKLVEDKKIDDRFQLGSEMYLLFLGQYPRDMMSVFYSLRDMLKSMTELLNGYYENNNISQGAMPLDFIDNMHEIIIKFISAAVSSNQNLSMFSRPIRDFVKTKLLHWQLYVDYAKVLEIFTDERYVKGNKQDCSPFVEMICLLNFVEQLIILVMPQRRTPHGDKELNSLLRFCEIEVVKPVKDIDLLFRQYYLFESMHLIPKFNISREEQRESFLKGIVELKFEKQFSDRKDAIKSREWYELVAMYYFGVIV